MQEKQQPVTGFLNSVFYYWGTKNDSRVGHLILRALAIRASNTQNALARISFHSPKSLFLFSAPLANHSLIVIMLWPGPANLPFRRKHPCPVLLVCTPLKTFTGSFWVYSFLFLFNDFRNSGNILLHFAKESLHFFKLTRRTHFDLKQFSCNVVVTSVKNSS